jgi:hypothetical protein
VIEEQHHVRDRCHESRRRWHERQAYTEMHSVKLGIESHGGPVIMIRVQGGERRIMGRKPLTMMRPQSFGRGQDADPAVLLRRLQLQEADRAQALDELIDVPVAGKPEQGNLLLQTLQGSPGLAAFWIVGGFEDTSEVKNQEPAGLDDQPDKKGISVINFEEMVEIDLPRLGQARMAGNVLKLQAQLASDEALQFVLLQAQTPLQMKVQRYRLGPIHAMLSECDAYLRGRRRYVKNKTAV